MTDSQKTIERYRLRRQARLDARADGSESSGNWGHVGREGKVGGSQKGGGSAFRVQYTGKAKGLKQYTSQAQLRNDHFKAINVLLTEIDDVEEKLSGTLTDSARKRLQSQQNVCYMAYYALMAEGENKNLTTKTSLSEEKAKRYKNGYSLVKTPNPNASAGILADIKRGASVTSANNRLSIEKTKQREAYEKALHNAEIHGTKPPKKPSYEKGDIYDKDRGYKAVRAKGGNNSKKGFRTPGSKQKHKATSEVSDFLRNSSNNNPAFLSTGASRLKDIAGYDD